MFSSIRSKRRNKRPTGLGRTRDWLPGMNLPTPACSVTIVVSSRFDLSGCYCHVPTVMMDSGNAPTAAIGAAIAVNAPSGPMLYCEMAWLFAVT